MGRRRRPRNHRSDRGAFGGATLLLVTLVAGALACAACSSAPEAAGSSSASAPRTIPLAPTSSAHRSHEGSSVLLVGDSLTVGANDNGLTTLLEADGWQVETIAEEGWSTHTGIVYVDEVDRVAPLVVVEMGTNPDAKVGGFAAEIQQMVDDLVARGAQRIIWVTPHHRTDNRYDAKDDAIKQAAAADSRIVVADWHVLAMQHPEWMVNDGLHYTKVGYSHLAAFIADAVDANALR